MVASSVDRIQVLVDDAPTRTSEVYERPPFDAPRSLAISSLYTDKRYSVGYKESVVRQILEEGWNHIAAGFVKVNLRPDGTLWILDGPSRVEAARRLGLSYVWGEVFHFKTVAEEAYWSRRWNIKMAALTALERFRTALEAGDPNKIAINNIARKNGFRITSSRLIDYSLSAVTTLEKTYNIYGATSLDFILRVASRSWEGEPESTVDDILKAILVLSVCYPEQHQLDEEDLVFRLSEHKAVWWRREAEADRGDHPLFVKLAARFLKAYNYYKHNGTRGGKLPMFDLETASRVL